MRPALALGLQWPLTLLALSFAFFLAEQISAIGSQQEAYRFQLTNADALLPKLEKSEQQYKDMVVQREPVLKQSAAVQKEYQSLLTDLLDLAKDDKDAQEVVATWKIQRNAAP